ncbi:tetratricopeptide repeat protein [candidate division KSB1 bacterium]|nr:tetratricopeptide repeat protein [candidate division KSB1 bacterium]
MKRMRRNEILNHDTRISVYFVLMSIFLLSTSTSLLQSQPASREPEPVVNKIDAKDELVRLNEIISQCERTIALYPQSDFTPTTMFQLSKLSLRREKLLFEFKLDKFLAVLERFDKGILKEEPQEPKIDFTKSIQLCEDILNNFKDIDFREDVLYWYGLCLFENSQRKEAADVFKTILQEFPRTEYENEINFRIGEYFFDAQDYGKAIQTYSKTIQTWNNPFFAMALYKLAWSYYKIENYSQSISTFFYLLGDLDMIDSLNCAEIGRSNVDLREESIDYIAICFSEYGELPLARKFLSDTKCGASYKTQILHSLADVYRKRSYYDKALAIYHELLKDFPFYSEAPEIQKSVFECYNQQQNEVQALKARENLVRRFGLKSAWAAKNPGKEQRDKVTEYIKSIDFILATPVINKADEMLSAGKLEPAIKIYRDFVRNFSRDERAPRALFNASECLYELKQYHKAARHYNLFVKKYAPHELTEDAAYNRIICYDQLMRLETEKKPDTLIFSFARKKYPVITESRAQKELLTACNEFLIIVPKGEKTVEILLKSAEQLAKLEQYPPCENLLHAAVSAITRRNLGHQFYTQAASLIAQVSYKQNKFKEAEKWYALVAASAGDSVNLTENSLKMMASSRYKIAENLMAKGDSAKAALEFERVALRYGKSEIGERSTFEAAVQHEKSGNVQRAAKLFELFARRYPESEHVEQSMLRAARIRESLGNWKDAAQNYMKIYNRNPGSEMAPTVLFSAGMCYENCGYWNMVALIFSKYHTNYPNDPTKVIEAMFKEGQAYYAQKNYADAVRVLNRMLYAHQSLKEKNVAVDDYYAAQAKFTMGEIDFQKFKMIKLNPPFEANMQRKQVVFNEMLQNYTATTKYEIADWTTASFFKIASAFETFAQDIMESPSPEGATKEQVKAYRATIWEKLAKPLKVKALDYYQANDRLATQISMTNEWIQKSRQRISELSGELTDNTQLSSSKQTANITEVSSQN